MPFMGHAHIGHGQQRRLAQFRDLRGHTWTRRKRAAARKPTGP